MDKNYKLLNKIGMSILMQYPPQNFISANNTWNIALNNYLQKKYKKGFTCLCNNSDCDGKAIDSHSIPKKNLKYMSKNSKVYVLKDDNYKNPFKSMFTKKYIKHTLTFPGFCKFHDTGLFQKIENSDGGVYTNEDIFFLSYRALAKEYSDYRDSIICANWELKNWNTKIKKKLDKEIALFYASPLINQGKTSIHRKWFFYKTYINNRLKSKICLTKILKDNRDIFKIYKYKIREFNDEIKSKKIPLFHNIVLKNENQIAFSAAVFLSYKKHNAFLYVTSLPQKEYSQLIISCSEDDYKLMRRNITIESLFKGDEKVINKILNNCKESISVQGDLSTDYKYTDTFIMEWNLPIMNIDFYKKTRLER